MSKSKTNTMPKKKNEGVLHMNTRDKQINLRLSQQEHERLTKEAALKGIGRATYLRMLLFESWRREDAGGKKG